MKIVANEKHEVSFRVSLSHKELEELIAQAVADRIPEKPRIKGSGISYDVSFEDATEGSPSYKVGTKAVVTIKRDMLAMEVSAPATDEPL